jgi:exodeoxyribonuclease VII large subunit
MEETFGRVRVRGELGRVTVARSGHCYLDLKDDKAVINSIIWKGVMGRLPVAPEEGMEVIVEGRMSTYPGRSNYQLIIESLELAGAGALMALLEKRKKMFAAEGLFAPERKRELPYLPKVIGVVTSPTGAVIRDILHRIEDRFPVRVILWPVQVQGERAAGEIAAAITGFNSYTPTPDLPRPDVLIVGRGGGSMEDLWCFNEEVVVRAAANSDIPLISAVGHETDTTLIDYVSDLRAPTPTGAAEVAVPVRADLMFTLGDYEQRLARALRRTNQDAANRLRGARLPRRERLLEGASQKLDMIRFPKAEDLFREQRRRVEGARLPSPVLRLQSLGARVQAMRLPQPERMLREKRAKLSTAGALLEALSYQGVLARGFALVSDADGKIVRGQAGLNAGERVTLEFGDGKRGAVIEGGVKAKPKSKPKAKSKPRAKARKDATPTGQQSLF